MCKKAIYLEDAIEEIDKIYDRINKRLKSLPPAVQSKQSTEVQDILQYLNEYLHPIVSPENWSIYSELYDKISMLLPTHPEIIKCKDCKYSDPNGKYGCKVYHYSRYETHEMKPDDFYSRAERKVYEQSDKS